MVNAKEFLKLFRKKFRTIFCNQRFTLKLAFKNCIFNTFCSLRILLHSRASILFDETFLSKKVSFWWSSFFSKERGSMDSVGCSPFSFSFLAQVFAKQRSAFLFLKEKVLWTHGLLLAKQAIYRWSTSPQTNRFLSRGKIFWLKSSFFWQNFCWWKKFKKNLKENFFLFTWFFLPRVFFPHLVFRPLYESDSNHSNYCAGKQSIPPACSRTIYVDVKQRVK